MLRQPEPWKTERIAQAGASIHAVAAGHESPQVRVVKRRRRSSILV
jgi:hypothetical protein